MTKIQIFGILLADMRLWHIDLVDVLPRQQLLGQWRELCCIASNIKKNNTPNHLLVNKILDFSWLHFKSYCVNVIDEMKKRGYKVCEEKLWKNKFGVDDIEGTMYKQYIYEEWHNQRYLKQCLYNLQEKYDCGGVSDEEWQKISKKFHYLLD